MRLGTWARSGEIVGIVAAVRDGVATLFDPGDRRVTTVGVGDLEPVPAGAVETTVTVALPLPHGLGEDTLRRWLATLTDPVLRERATEALEDAGLDAAAVLPQARVEVRAAAPGSGARCLCGVVTPAEDGTAVACQACGRQAVAPPLRRG
ncbi:MAG TPA: hypothetical protein VIK95_04235 [Egibacteraceae bacterium]